MSDTNEYINKLLEELENIDTSTYNPHEKYLRDRISEIRYAQRKRNYHEGRKEAYTNVARSLLKLNMSEIDIFNSIEGLSSYISLKDLEKIKNDLIKK